MKLEYPKVLFHATEDPALVADPVAHAALGAGWYESPTEALEAATAPVAVVEAPAVEEPVVAVKPVKGEKAGK